MKRSHGERGQALVEFAFAGSIFLTLFLAIIEFSRALFAYDMVAQAARVGTRFASTNTPVLQDCSVRYDAAPVVGTCQQTIMTYIYSKSQIRSTDLASPKTAIAFSGPDPLCATFPTPALGCSVSVHLAYNFTFIGIPLPALVLDSTSQVNLTSQ